jgi:hypothetical protein
MLNLTQNNHSLLFGKTSDNPGDSILVEHLLKSRPGLFEDILKRKDELGVQIIYTEINRDKKNKNLANFTEHYFNVDSNRYFYPASTVKFPVAVLALQKLKELHISKYASMMTGKSTEEQTSVVADSSAPNNKPTVAHYIKKILLVSDNDAFNRLYEFLGQEYINNTLHKMGYVNTQIIHRLSVPLTEQQNRNTNPVIFYDEKTGKLIYSKLPETSALVYAKRNTKMGNGYMQGDKLINAPFDFSTKNRLLLNDLHDMVRAIMFPGSVEPSKRFNLDQEDYDFLRKYMSMTPGEAVYPKYDTSEYWDNYVKFMYYGSEKTKPEPGVRIFGKTGDAYGFMIESCYFADFNNKVEFMLSAVIYCNSDGIFNDDKYDYDSLGFPFFKNLGRTIYEYELKRKKMQVPDLSAFRYNYTDQK